MSEHETEQSSGRDDAATSALPGGGDSQYGNDTGFADEALNDGAGNGGSDDEPAG